MIISLNRGRSEAESAQQDARSVIVGGLDSLGVGRVDRSERTVGAPVMLAIGGIGWLREPPIKIIRHETPPSAEVTTFGHVD